MAGSEPNTSDDSPSTVELEINQSPPARMTLRSHARKTHDTSSEPSQQDDNTPSNKADESQDADVDELSKKPKPVRKKRQNKKQSKHTSKAKKPKVAFQLPPQQTIRRDGVDKQCRALNIKYKRWTGTTEPKQELHKSQCNFNDKGYIPRQQAVGADCVLCPSQKNLKDDWDLRRHYRGTHQENLLVMENVVMLQCKCSAMQSRGWDRDHSTRNAHYHCSICHWPWDKPSQIKNHLRAIHGKDNHEVQHLKSNPVRRSR